MKKHLLLFTTSPPFSLSWEGDFPGSAPAAKPIRTNPALTKADRFVCAQCGADTTRASLRIAIGGSHRHILPGSFGVDQEIGCFSLAPGCALLGPFALDFFNPTGGQWRMAVCATCGAHLGWHHQTAEGIGFYGLFLELLNAAPKDAEEASD